MTRTNEYSTDMTSIIECDLDVHSFFSYSKFFTIVLDME